MTYMQTCPGRIRKHVEDIKFWFAAVYFNLVSTVIAPALLPAAFYIFMIVFHFF